MVRRVLLTFGILSSLMYVATDVIGAVSYPGYDYASQAVSEMSAIGAPTADLLRPFYLVYALLFTGFGLGVWVVGTRAHLRATSACLIGVGLLGLVGWPFFPMHMRGANGGMTDTMHLVLGGADVLLLTLAIAFASTRFSERFRFYSWSTIVVMLLAGGLTSHYVPDVAAGRETPWLGVLERMSLAAYLLWIAVLSLKLLHRSSRAASMPAALAAT